MNGLCEVEGLQQNKQIRKLKEVFLQKINNTVTIDEIPDELILIFDWTTLNYVPVTS